MSPGTAPARANTCCCVQAVLSQVALPWDARLLGLIPRDDTSHVVRGCYVPTDAATEVCSFERSEGGKRFAKLRWGCANYCRLLVVIPALCSKSDMKT